MDAEDRVGGRGQRHQPLGKARLLHRQLAQDIGEERLFAGVVAVERLLRGDTSLGQNGVNAGRQIPLPQKQPVGSGPQPFPRLLSAPVRPIFRFHSPHLTFRTVPYRTVRL